MTERELYYARKAARLCVRCGAMLDADDGACCKSCTANERKRRAERKENRICTRCGQLLEEGDKHLDCEKCRAKINRGERRRKRKQREERIQTGVCTKCGKKPPMEGNAVCEKCREVNARRYKAWKQHLAEAKAKEEK